MWKGPVFAFTAFLGSFLLFLIQPMVAKNVLPFYGGAASVWTTCLLFFQLALFLGYTYAALATRRAHIVAMALAAETLWGLASPSGPNSQGSAAPLSSLLFYLAADIGVPFVVLSAGSTLVQRWAGSYSLYAVSNAGSLLALLAYPVVVEPLLGLPSQRKLWNLCLLVYFGLLGFCLWVSRPQTGKGRSWDETGQGVGFRSRPEWRRMALWAAWSAGGTALLAATTNQLSQEVAAVPFLWVAPLSLYLASFIVVFPFPKLRSYTFWSMLLPVAAMTAVALLASGPSRGYLWHLLGDLGVLSVCLMLCHGQLAETRPAESSLGWFYAAMSFGGAVGGAFVAVLAPLVFSTYIEFPLALAALAALSLGVGLLGPEGLIVEPATARKRAVIFSLSVAMMASLWGLFAADEDGLIEVRRNFYGVLQVTERNETQGPLRTFVHGQTIHGTQWILHPEWPTTYFSENSGAGRAILDEQRLHPRGMRVGLIGLGAGTLAHYARPGLDTFRFYELNPAVVDMAKRHFTYLNPSKNVEIVLGDARVSLEREVPMQEPPYDLFLVDAFSSDSIPVHLLTREAALVYARRVKPEGTMMFHISNRSWRLEPVMRGVARVLHRKLDVMKSGDQPSRGNHAAEWIRLSPGSYEGPDGIVWTDAYSSLWPILRKR